MSWVQEGIFVKFRVFWFTLWVSLLALSSAAWGQGIRLGEEFQVNSYTTAYQAAPKAAMGPDGRFLVVWQSHGPDGSSASAQGQLFGPGGQRIGSEFQVNTYTTNGQFDPNLAVNPDGTFLVVWMSSQDGGISSLQGQRFGPEGNPLGSEFLVNSYTPYQEVNPAVAADAGGNFVVVWTSFGQDGSGWGIRGRRFSSEGAPLGQEFQINSYTTDNQVQADVATDSEGNFIVVWQADEPVFEFGIRGQRLRPDGTRIGSEFQVESYTTDNQTRPAVAMSPEGEFMVTWIHRDFGFDGGELNIRARLFGSDGLPLAGEFMVGDFLKSYQAYPDVAFDPTGHFIVSWSGSEIGGSSSNVLAQLYRLDGQAVGGEFQVNSSTTGRQRYPTVAADSNDRFVVSWRTEHFGELEDVAGQLFSTAFFADGFESGEASDWSGIVSSSSAK